MDTDQRRKKSEHLWKQFIAEGIWQWACVDSGLFGEAKNCYVSGYYVATCILCRVIIEDTLYRLYLQKRNEESGPCYAIEKEKPNLEDLKKWAKEKGLIDKDTHDKIGFIQERGNIEAHGRTKKLIRLVEKDPEKPVRWVIEEREAFEQLKNMFQILINLYKKHANRIDL